MTTDGTTALVSSTTTTSSAEGATVRRAAAASFIGNFIEWFDYATYSYLAVVIGQVFFPSSDKTVETMSAFGVFAMSFLLRPVGAVVWGAWGDRFGRRWALSWSILIMSGSTFLIAFLPGYSTLGMGAALLLLLLRLTQGFSASGEYAGAGTFLAEYAPPSRRGLYTSMVPASTATGLLAGSSLVALLHALLDDASMASWGWRIPFLMAGPLGLIGRYIRVHLEDSPAFQEMQAQLEEKSGPQQSTPVLDLLRYHGRTVGIAFGVSCLNAVGFYLLLTYMPTYLQEEVHIGKSTSNLLTSVMLIAYIVSIFIMGHFSDTVGRRKMLMGASVAFIVLSVPLFWLMDSGSIVGILVCEVLFAIVLTANDGTLATFLAESFPTEVRYSGFALSFNTANALLGGTASLVATFLISKTGSPLAPAIYLSVVALAALGAMIAAPEHSDADLTAYTQESADAQP